MNYKNLIAVLGISICALLASNALGVAEVSQEKVKDEDRHLEEFLKGKSAISVFAEGSDRPLVLTTSSFAQSGIKPLDTRLRDLETEVSNLNKKIAQQDLALQNVEKRLSAVKAK